VKVSLTFAGGLVVTLAVAFTVVKYLTTPLRQQLQELCGNAERAAFWTSFSNVMLVLTPRGVRNAGGSMVGRLRSAAGRCGVACEVGAYRAGNVSPHAGPRFRPLHSPNTRTPSLPSCRTEAGR
jgi:hypothetical protein